MVKKLVPSQIRYLIEYEIWRQKVLFRDNHKCTKCGATGKLTVHHKIRLPDIVEKNNIRTIEQAKNCKALWNPDNGLTLCKKCHDDIDYFGMR